MKHRKWTRRVRTSIVKIMKEQAHFANSVTSAMGLAIKEDIYRI